MAKALEKPSFIIFSPWIEKKIWATFEDGVHHISVHLNDFKPEFIWLRKPKKNSKKIFIIVSRIQTRIVQG